MVTHFQDVVKKGKKRMQKMQEEKEYKQTKMTEKLHQKKMRMTDLHKTFLEKLQSIEKKREEKDHILTTIKGAFGSYNSQKKEIT